MDAEPLLRDLRSALIKLQPDAYLTPDELWLFLDQWEEKTQKQEDEKALAAEMERLRLADEQRRRDAFLEAHIKLLSAVFEKANAYVNLLVIAGYAAFFALWSFTKEIDAISQPLRRWAVLCMLVSVCIFVVFETGKMVFTGWVTTTRQRLFAKNAGGMTLEQLEAAANQMQAGIDRANLKLLALWPYSLALTAGTAAVAVAMVVCAIMGPLFDGKI